MKNKVKVTIIKYKEKKMEALLFQNPVFHNGVNITCRKGNKWYKKLNGKIGELIDIQETSGSLLGKVRVNGLLLLPLEQLYDGLLEVEHDPSCRSAYGLHKELERIYGRLSLDTEITVVFFSREQNNE